MAFKKYIKIRAKNHVKQSKITINIRAENAVEHLKNNIKFKAKRCGFFRPEP
jgi:hypothetical protein